MNNTIYQDNLVTIDSEVVRIGATQYDLDGIVSFTGQCQPKSTCLARGICFLLFAIGIIRMIPVINVYRENFHEKGIDFDSKDGNQALTMIFQNFTMALVFLVPAFLVLLWIRSRKDTYAIQFQTSAGSVEAVSSHNEKYIDQLLAALGDAKRQSKALRR